jgi:DNA-binding GntR family transcriptional regulator
MTQSLRALADQELTFERTFLKDQIIDLLRDQIIQGHIAPGTALSERELARLFGLSRIPVRDALQQLEAQGLVVTRSTGRCVVELTKRDVRELFRVRRALEQVAVELAAQNITPANHDALLAELDKMKDAATRGDAAAFTACDVEMHRLVWQQADNGHLLRALDAIIGPVFMFVARNAVHYDWNETLDLHQELVACIGAGDVGAARDSIERHLQNSEERALQVFPSSG